MTSLCWNPLCSAPHNADGEEFCTACKTPLLLQGRYRSHQVLGKNALGRTILAEDTQQRGQILLKQLQKEPSVFARAAQLHQLPPYPGIPRLWASFTEGEYCYWVQEYCEGQSLAALRQSKPFTEPQIWQVLVPVLPILHFLHDHQVIHGNITPENILFSRSQFYLIDIGIPIGDPEYAAPEQLEGYLSPASDIYSLGLTCCYLLGGISPFAQRESSIGMEWGDSVLGEILSSMTAPLPLQRFASVPEVIATIERRKAIKIPSPQYPSPSNRQQETLLTSPGILFPAILSLALHPVQPLLVASRADQTLLRYNLSSQETLKRKFPKPIDALWGTACYLIAGDRDGVVHFLSWETLETQHTFPTPCGAIKSLALHPQEHILASGGSDGRIHLWQKEKDIATWQPLGTLTEHLLGINSLAFSPNGKILASGGMDATLILWDWQRQELLEHLRGHNWLIETIAFHPQGHLLASAGLDNDIRIWEIPSGKCLRLLSGHAWRITGLSFTPDGEKIISASWDKSLKLWSVEQGSLLETIAIGGSAITCLQLHEDRQILIGDEKGTVLLVFSV